MLIANTGQYMLSLFSSRFPVTIFYCFTADASRYFADIDAIILSMPALVAFELAMTYT